MGEWKAPLSLRVKQIVREEMQAIADREHRSLGNVGEVLMEWGLEQLKAAESLDQLLKSRITKRSSVGH